ncbi:hypothetical protein B0H14DRAFT_2561818 [Mycena olivaceomarginata]|nr:hypothetical protein B0H14DRAFT_2561818 [Mycena olivaceomarginata]
MSVVYEMTPATSQCSSQSPKQASIATHQVIRIWEVPVFAGGGRGGGEAHGQKITVTRGQKTRKGNQLTGNSESAVANFGVHLGATIVVERSGLRLSLATAAANFTCPHHGGEKWARTFTCDHRGGKNETRTLAFDHGSGGVWAKIPVTR